jgi:hypothetical protein
MNSLLALSTRLFAVMGSRMQFPRLSDGDERHTKKTPLSFTRRGGEPCAIRTARPLALRLIHLRDRGWIGDVPGHRCRGVQRARIRLRTARTTRTTVDPSPSARDRFAWSFARTRVFQSRYPWLLPARLARNVELHFPKGPASAVNAARRLSKQRRLQRSARRAWGRSSNTHLRVRSPPHPRHRFLHLRRDRRT